MMKPEEDTVFHNVQLHSQGRKEYGSLYLTRHHFFFRYFPQPKQGGEANGASASPARSNVNSSNGRNSAEQQKQRPVDMWVPYPMVNFCLLRPAHSLGHAARQDLGNTHVAPHQDNGEHFPPVYGTAFEERASTDSSQLAPFSSPSRSTSPGASRVDVTMSTERSRQPAIRIRLKDFRMMALHFHSATPDTSPEDQAREAFFLLRTRCCVDQVEDFHAFHFHPPKIEGIVDQHTYDAQREYARMGISDKAADGVGTAWRISEINRDYSYSETYPSVLCVPRALSDNILKHGGAFRSKARIPCLSYLHSNGGSITRASQPKTGIQNKRNPQDERLVSAIFSSHTPPLLSPEDPPSQASTLTSPSSATLETDKSDSLTLDSDAPGLPRSQSDTALNEKSDENSDTLRRKVYGSTRQNFIIDARPRLNAHANRAGGGGMEDVSNYQGNGDMPVEYRFLNIANIHAMRASLEKVVEALANSDYIRMKPNQEVLRKSGWLGHIAAVLEGADMVARVVGLGGSHVLVHCSDGWDRTAQITALAQVIMDPHCRTLNGIVTLIQKEFLSFGHKFRDRNGIEGSEKWFEIENERIAPSRKLESNSSDPSGMNVFGARAFSGAKTWLGKNRRNLFGSQSSNQDGTSDESTSRPSSPPPNSVIHSPPNDKTSSAHKMDEKEVSPIFHQFLDAVFQLQYQYPEAFEFTERFLQRLFYYVYSCQYGDFLFNTERERTQHQGKLPSVWSHFYCRRAEFINADYVAQVDDPLLFPKRQGRDFEVRWWTKLFGRQDEDMNTPRALAPADPPTLEESAGPTVSFDEKPADIDEEMPATKHANGATKESKSNSSFGAMRDSLSNSFSALSVRKSVDQTEIVKDVKQSHSSDRSAAADLVAEQPRTQVEEANIAVKKQEDPATVESDGDPLGVTASFSHKEKGGLDSAAFASQNAFRDR